MGDLRESAAELRLTSNFDVDCDHCVGLCCVAPKITKGEDFPFDKGASVPCSNLNDQNRCDIYDKLDEQGCHGCVAYTCYGAGQNITRFYELDQKGRSWRDSPEHGEIAFEAYFNLRNMLECVVKLSSLGARTGNLMVLEYSSILKEMVKDLSALPEKADVEGFMHVTQIMLEAVAQNPALTFEELTSG